MANAVTFLHFWNLAERQFGAGRGGEEGRVRRSFENDELIIYAPESLKEGKVLSWNRASSFEWNALLRGSGSRVMKRAAAGSTLFQYFDSEERRSVWLKNACRLRRRTSTKRLPRALGENCFDGTILLYRPSRSQFSIYFWVTKTRICDHVRKRARDWCLLESVDVYRIEKGKKGRKKNCFENEGRNRLYNWQWRDQDKKDMIRRPPLDEWK